MRGWNRQISISVRSTHTILTTFLEEMPLNVFRPHSFTSDRIPPSFREKDRTTREQRQEETLGSSNCRKKDFWDFYDQAAELCLYVGSTPDTFHSFFQQLLVLTAWLALPCFALAVAELS